MESKKLGHFSSVSINQTDWIMLWLLGSCLMLTQVQLLLMVRAFVLNYGVCVLSWSSHTPYIQEKETWRVVKTDSLHSAAFSHSSCTSSLCVSPSLPLHLWRLMVAWTCAGVLLLSFFSIAFIFPALLPCLSISNSLFLSSTGQSGFVTLRHMHLLRRLNLMYDNMLFIWVSRWVCSDMWYVICLQSEGSFNTRCF